VKSANYSVEIAPLVEKARNGDKLAENRLAELLMWELRRIASVYLGRDFLGDSMWTGDLINEIYLSEPISEKYHREKRLEGGALASPLKWVRDGINRKRRDSPANFFLINEPFSSGRTRLLMKCGEVADINRPLRDVAQQ